MVSALSVEGVGESFVRMMELPCFIGGGGISVTVCDFIIKKKKKIKN